MFQSTTPHASQTKWLFFALLMAGLLLLSGCATLMDSGPGGNSSSKQTATDSQPEPYHPAAFKDLLIPSELTWVREKSMVIKTESFAGGVYLFTGKVEVNSLSDFFTTTMVQNGWKLAGSIQYKQVLLAFTKPGKTCTMMITEGDYSGKTDVQIYIADDIAQGRSSAPAGKGLLF